MYCTQLLQIKHSRGSILMMEVDEKEPNAFACSDETNTLRPESERVK